MRVRFLLFVLLFIFSASSISTAEEELTKKVHKAGQQERGSTSTSLAGGEKDGYAILQETNGTSPKEIPQPPSAPKALKIITKTK